MIKKQKHILSVILLLASSIMLCGFDNADKNSNNENSGAGYELSPFMGAMTEGKKIYSDENKDIEVIALGYIEELDKDEDPGLHGVIKITNKTDEKLPYSLQECVINGYCYSCDDECIIRPKKSYFSEFYIESEEIEAEGVDSISSISLYLMTDIEDNSSIKGEKMMGGNLYDVPLDIKGNDEISEIDGDLIYDDNDIKVYVTKSKYNSYESIGFPHSVTYDVIIENNMDKDITFDYSELKCEENDLHKSGTYVGDWDEEGIYGNSNYDKNVIPKGCRKHDSIYFNSDIIEPSCELTCRFDFMKPGAGQILFRSDEIKFICPEEEPEE